MTRCRGRRLLGGILVVVATCGLSWVCEGKALALEAGRQPYPPPAPPPRPTNATLGAAVTTNSPSWGHIVKRADVKGALILGSAPHTPAEDAHLVRGDVVVGIDDQLVEGADKYTTELRVTGSADHSLSIVGSDGTARIVRVRLAAGNGLPLSYASYVRDIHSQDPVDQFLIATGGPDTGAALNAANSLVAAHPDFGFGRVVKAARLLDSLQTGTEQAIKQTVADLAIADVTSALASDPESPDVLLGAAKISARLGDVMTATDFARQAVSGNTSSADGQYTLGSLLLQRGQSIDALPVLRQSLDLDPYSIGHYQGLARAYAAVGRTVDANITNGVARVLTLRQGQHTRYSHRTKVLTTSAIAVTGACFIAYLIWGFSSHRVTRRKDIASHVANYFARAQVSLLLELLVIVGLWTLVVPILAPVFGVSHLASTRLRIANYWIPGTIVVVASVVGFVVSFVDRPRQRWLITFALLPLLCGLWMLSTHVGMARAAVVGTEPWGNLVHYAGTGVVIVVLSALIIFHMYVDAHNIRGNSVSESKAA